MKKHIMKLLLDELLKPETTVQMENLLYGLFTPEEIMELSRRLKIVKMLKKGVPQHKIAKKLGVGVATVTRGSRELKRGLFKYV